MSLIDTCLNLFSNQFNEDRSAVLSRAYSSGVHGMMLTAADLADARQAIEFCTDINQTRGTETASQSSELYCTAGVHPHHAGQCAAGWDSQLLDLAKHDSVRAIGEMGLDFNRNFSPREEQLNVFNRQIEIALEVNKPLFVHDRDSNGKVYEQLTQHSSLPPVVIHCFTGTPDDLERYVGEDFYVGVTGWICDKRRGDQLRELVHKIPLNRLLIETDAPYLKPHNAPKEVRNESGEIHKFGRRNESALLPYVLEMIGLHRTEDTDAIAEATTQNARRLFGFSF